MAIAVDWDVKHQTKQTNHNVHSNGQSVRINKFRSISVIEDHLCLI